MKDYCLEETSRQDNLLWELKKKKIEGRHGVHKHLQVWYKFIVKQEEFCTLYIHIVTIILILQLSDP